MGDWIMPLTQDNNAKEVNEVVVPMVLEDEQKEPLDVQLRHQIDELEAERKKVVEDLNLTQQKYDQCFEQLKKINAQIEKNGKTKSAIQEKKEYVAQLESYETASRTLFYAGLALTIALCIATVVLASVTFGLSALAGVAIMGISASLGKYLENKKYDKKMEIAYSEESLDNSEYSVRLEREPVDKELKNLDQIKSSLTEKFGFFSKKIEEIRATEPQSSMQPTH
jgi:hypothetical protein